MITFHMVENSIGVASVVKRSYFSVDFSNFLIGFGAVYGYGCECECLCVYIVLLN